MREAGNQPSGINLPEQNSPCPQPTPPSIRQTKMELPPYPDYAHYPSPAGRPAPGSLPHQPTLDPVEVLYDPPQGVPPADHWRMDVAALVVPPPAAGGPCARLPTVASAAHAGLGLRSRGRRCQGGAGGHHGVECRDFLYRHKRGE